MESLKNIIKLALAALAVLLLPATAHAQFAVGGSSAPTTISADYAEYQGNKTILTGGVDVRQGDVRVLADKMTVHSTSTGGVAQSEFTRIVAEGNFYYLTPDQEVRGHKGVYTKVDDTFVVTGDVILKSSDGNVITGSTLYYNLTTQNARVVGTCEGRKCGSNKRVNILITNSASIAGSTS